MYLKKYASGAFPSQFFVLWGGNGKMKKTDKMLVTEISTKYAKDDSMVFFLTAPQAHGTQLFFVIYPPLFSALFCLREPIALHGGELLISLTACPGAEGKNKKKKKKNVWENHLLLLLCLFYYIWFSFPFPSLPALPVVFFVFVFAFFIFKIDNLDDGHLSNERSVVHFSLSLSLSLSLGQLSPAKIVQALLNVTT